MLSKKFNVKSFFFESCDKLQDYVRDNAQALSQSMQNLRSFTSDTSGKLYSAGIALTGAVPAGMMAHGFGDVPFSTLDKPVMAAVGASMLCTIAGLMTQKPHENATLKESLKHNAREVYKSVLS